MVCLSLATTPVSAQYSGCARVSISIQTGTATVAPGTTVGIAGSVNNCSAKKARYTVVVSAMSSCGQKADLASKRMALASGENTMYTVSYPIPSNTCDGPLEATVQVRDNSGALATSTTTIVIE
jgi:hypothetical protein